MQFSFEEKVYYIIANKHNDVGVYTGNFRFNRDNKLTFTIEKKSEVSNLLMSVILIEGIKLEGTENECKNLTLECDTTGSEIKLGRPYKLRKELARKIP